MPCGVAFPPIRDVAAARRLFAPLVAEPCEVAAVAYLDPEWRLLGMRHIRSRFVDTIEVPVRAIAADALAFDASGLVIAHTHPSGDCTPSAADIAITRRLLRALEALDVRLLDHLVLAGDSYSSLAELGYL